MGDRTSIAWCDATWNPLRGCTRIAQGCVNCYAERMAARGLPGLNSPTTGQPFAIMTPSGPRWTGKVELIKSQLDVPFRWRKPIRIFVNSMSDTFHEAVPVEWIWEIWSAMNACRQHTFQVLTKRGRRMREVLSMWIPDGDGWVTPDLYAGAESQCPIDRKRWPLPNVWLGISASTRHDLAAQVEHLRATPAAVRFLSLEPLIEDIGDINLSGIGWVIVGGESGPGARPMGENWVRSIRDQCEAAGVPFFYKQRIENGRKVELPMLDGRQWAEFPEVRNA